VLASGAPTVGGGPPSATFCPPWRKPPVTPLPVDQCFSTFVQLQ